MHQLISARFVPFVHRHIPSTVPANPSTTTKEDPTRAKQGSTRAAAPSTKTVEPLTKGEDRTTAIVDRAQARGMCARHVSRRGFPVAKHAWRGTKQDQGNLLGYMNRGNHP